MVIANTNPPEIMNIRQCADYLGISPDTMYQYAMEGKIRGFKLGNRWRFKKDMVDAWIKAECDKNDREEPVR